MSKTRLAPVAATFVAIALAPFLAACGSGGGGATAAASNGRLELRNVRIDRPALASQAAVRLVIDNRTDHADTLKSVSSPDAERADVHRSSTDSAGRSVMGPTGPLDLPAQGKVTFAPGGLHVMLDGLTRHLAVGDTVELTFTFAKAGTRTVKADVAEPGADAGSDHTDMDHMEKGTANG